MADTATYSCGAAQRRGQVIKLDRGLPLVKLFGEGEDERASGGAAACAGPPAHAHAHAGAGAGAGAGPHAQAHAHAQAGANQQTPAHPDKNTDAYTGKASGIPADSPAAFGAEIRCEHSADMIKKSGMRAVIGDIVDVELPYGHDVGRIVGILPRGCEFVRKDPIDRARAQVLAANFDKVIIVSPLTSLNLDRLVRELVLAHQTGAKVAVVLTKADIAKDARIALASVRALCGADVSVELTSSKDNSARDTLRRLVPAGTLAVLIGKSGAGKSTLINAVCGADVAQTGSVRATDDKGRHTTVAREIMAIPGAGRIIDMPGVRGLGLWEGRTGIEVAFKDITNAARKCRFRDCTHKDEPGCAVLQAVCEGKIANARLESYHALLEEQAQTDQKREAARRAQNKSAQTKRRKR